MWYEGPDGVPVGVLCDWDLAEGHTDGDIRAVQPEHHGLEISELGSNMSKEGSKGLFTAHSMGQAPSQIGRAHV